MSGLAAAKELSERGYKVIVLEARDRVGGRIYSVSEPDVPIPKELGAEFIHSCPRVLNDALAEAKLKTYSIEDKHVWKLGKDFKPVPDFWERIDGVMKQLRKNSGPDRTFHEFLKSAQIDAETRHMVTTYVEGFHAADPRKISEHYLAAAEQTLDDEGAHGVARVFEGYSSLIHWYLENIPNWQKALKLNTVVSSIDWKRGAARVHAYDGDSDLVFKGSKVIVTIPVGVWKSQPGSMGYIRFNPEISDKRRVLDYFDSGPIVKIVMRFKERFWEERGQKISFIHSPVCAVPTWWSTEPVQTAILNGWAGGDYAKKLFPLHDSQVMALAISSLSTVTGVSEPEIRRQLASIHYHDWQKDPFSRGAYSYLMVGGLTAQKRMAAPVQDTLYFAGEAFNDEGQTGTVDAALRSARQTVRQILEAEQALRAVG